MTYDSLKFFIQHSINLHAAIIEEFLDTATDEEYAKLPTFLLSQEEKDFIWKQGMISHPLREYEPDESELTSVYSIGGMPFKIKVKQP